jgi:hypothetical protein
MWRPRLWFSVVAMAAGAASGAVFLGGGGRFAMYLFAIITARSSVFTLRGSLNVVLAGAVAGTVGGLLLALADRFLPKQLLWRSLVFGVLCYLIAIPGFRPPRALVFALFAPLFLAYGMATVRLLDRVLAAPSNTRLKLTAPGV